MNTTTYYIFNDGTVAFTLREAAEQSKFHGSFRVITSYRKDDRVSEDQ